MPLSLAELRQSPVAALPERTYSLCLAQALVAEVRSLQAERTELVVETTRDEDGNRTSRPKRQGESNPPRVAEIDARLEELWDEMREHTGELRLRAIAGGDWRRWADDHPARKDDEGQMTLADQATTFGFCNADDLREDLEKYVVSWEGAPLAEGDWEFITNRAALGDLKELCKLVVQMHEGPGASAPGKSPRPSSGTHPSGTG